jgi:hypothetical protein
VIRLAARLVVSGGRESVVRLVLTALGVGIGTTLLLLVAAADPAIRAQQSRTAWQDTVADPETLEGTGDPLLWWVQDDGVDGRIMTVVRVAATGPDSPAPLGLGHVPEPGEVHVSPALAELMDDLPADRLADRFPSAPSGTIADDYLAGPDDLVAVVGMPEGLLRAMDVPEVHSIRTSPSPYQFTDFLRAMFGIGAVGLLMPVLVLVSTSTRIGAARREQRFAALRLAGAKPDRSTWWRASRRAWRPRSAPLSVRSGSRSRGPGRRASRSTATRRSSTTSGWRRCSSSRSSWRSRRWRSSPPWRASGGCGSRRSASPVGRSAPARPRGASCPSSSGRPPSSSRWPSRSTAGRGSAR